MSDTTKPLTGEPRLASFASWAVLAASFGLSASTWVALAVLAGFTDTIALPFIDARFALAWLMPIAVDGYVVVALVLWMSPVPAKVAEFAKKNTYFAAGTGIVAQSAYHLLDTMSTDVEEWRVVLAAIVGALPPTVAGLAVHMRALIRRESGTTANPGTVPASPAPATTRPTQPTPPTSLVGLTAVPAGTTGPTAPALPATDPRPADPAPPEQARPEIPTPAQVATRVTPPATNRPDGTGRRNPAHRPLHRSPTGQDHRHPGEEVGTVHHRPSSHRVGRCTTRTADGVAGPARQGHPRGAEVPG